MSPKCSGCIDSAVPSNSTVCFKERVFLSVLWQGIGTWCTAHLTPYALILHGNRAGVPGYSWHGDRAKHLHRGRGLGDIQTVQDSTHDVIPFICISPWCGWLKATNFLSILQKYLGVLYSGLVAEYFNCFFILQYLRKLQIVPLKPDTSIQPPPALSSPCLDIPVCKGVASKARLCVQIPPLWWNYIGDEFSSLCLLGRTQSVAPITSRGYHLWPILTVISAQSANSSGGKICP